MSRKAGYGKRASSSSLVDKSERRKGAVRHFKDDVDIVADVVELDPFFSYESMESTLGKQRMEIHRLVQGYHEMAMKFLARKEATWRKADLEIKDLRAQLEDGKMEDYPRADSKSTLMSSTSTNGGSPGNHGTIAVLIARLEKNRQMLVQRDEVCRQTQAENFELREQLAAMQAVGATSSILSATLPDPNRIPAHSNPTWPPPKAAVSPVKILPSSQIKVLPVNAHEALVENSNVTAFLDKFNNVQSSALERLERAQNKLDAWATQHHPRPNPAEVGLVDYNTLEIGTIPGTIDEDDTERKQKQKDGGSDDEEEEEEDDEQFGYVRTGNKKLKGKKKLRRALSMKDNAKQMFAPTTKSADKYKDGGCIASTARSPSFENITMAAIALNTAWIGIDTTFNDSEVLFNAAPGIILGENLFCVWFVSEILIRYFAFRSTWYAITDFWFLFDLALVFFMVFETWIMFAVAAAGLGSGAFSFDPTLLRMLRLVRITRIARITRLLRELPEIMILLKCIGVATRSVFFCTVLLLAVVYIFAIAMTQLAEGDFKKDYWPSLVASMETLLFTGVFADGIYELASRCFKEHVLFGFTLCAFMVCAPMTIMNMLVGVLVEVVGIVAAAEQEAGVSAVVVEQLNTAMSKLDENNDGNISKDEFNQLLNMPDVIQLFNDVNIDVVAIIRDPDIVFAGDEELTFPDFIDEVMALRGSNPVTVKDIIQLRKQLLRELKGVVKRPPIRMSALSQPSTKTAWE
eukprot:TRINITY_DN7298_c1_g1_i1.p1 TRINITY_DN7298_c1_g1~~TRINITY_DN7298_c1_g1_i1.p1  ORF type:complete len:747 (-),score=143.25 TRINITY_DN7298_c1_g1_i1:38-2278(-)